MYLHIDLSSAREVILHEELNTMPDIQYFQGGYEEEKHDRALFGLLGGHDETHIHFDATAGGPAKDIWEKHSEILGGLLANSHDLHVHQDAGPVSGPTDIRVHDGSILGGLVLDDHKSDFKTQRMTANGMETRESHQSSGSSLGGIVAEGSQSTEKTSVQGADGVTHTEIKHESEGTVLGGIIAGGQDKSDKSEVTTSDGKTVTTHLLDDSSGEALGGVLAQGQEHTEFVDNGQGRIGIHTSQGSVLGGVIYSGDSGKVYGADLPGASAYLEVPSAYPQPISAAPVPPVSDNISGPSYPAIAPGADAASPPAVVSQGEVNIPPAAMAPGSKAADANVASNRAAITSPPGGDISNDGPLGQAHQQVVHNFIDPDTKQPIPQASVLRFDNSDYFLADGNNVRLFDSNNQRVNFAQEGPVAVAQSGNEDDLVVDPSTNKEIPRLTAQVSQDGKGVEFDFFSGLSISADKNGDYVTRQAAVTPPAAPH
jgi:hypothetical protein